MVVLGMLLFEEGGRRIKLVNKDEIVMHHARLQPWDVEIWLTRSVMPQVIFLVDGSGWSRIAASW